MMAEGFTIQDKYLLKDLSSLYLFIFSTFRNVIIEHSWRHIFQMYHIISLKSVMQICINYSCLLLPFIKHSVAGHAIKLLEFIAIIKRDQ